MILWVGFIANFGVIFPDGDSKITKILMNLTFVGVTWVLFLLCFYALPISALILVPDWQQSTPVVEPPQEPKLKQARDVDLDLLASMFGGYLGSRMGGNRMEDDPLQPEYTPQRDPRLLPDPDIVDVDYRDIGSGQPPSGSPNKSPSTDPPMSDDPVSPTSSFFPEPEATEASADHKYKPKASRTAEDPIPVIIIDTDTSSPEPPPPPKKEERPTPPAKKRSPLTAAKIAATADVVTTIAAASGHPEVAAAAQIVGTASSAYAAAKEVSKNKREDPIIS